VTNLSSDPVRLLGTERICMPWGCVDAMDFPVRVLPRSSSEFRVELRPPSKPFFGEFAGEIILYSDALGSEQTPLRLTGRVVRLAGQ
jgi:hypothetical protein